MRYATFRLADGTFIHIADIEADPNPLGGIAAFAAFEEGIVERCEPGEGPNPQPATLVGSCRFFADGAGSWRAHPKTGSLAFPQPRQPPAVPNPVLGTLHPPFPLHFVTHRGWGVVGPAGEDCDSCAPAA